MFEANKTHGEKESHFHYIVFHVCETVCKSQKPVSYEASARGGRVQVFPGGTAADLRLQGPCCFLLVESCFLSRR